VLAVVRSEPGVAGDAHAIGSKVRIHWPRDQMVMLEK
jgi:hypothetical protein